MVKDKQTVLKEKLASAVKPSIIRRTLSLPKRCWRKYSRLMKIVEPVREVKAHTFWNEEIDVILPEVVSTIIWKKGYFEEDVCLFMLNLLQDGMTFIDVGAHFGFFTLLGAYLVGEKGKVLSFEPIPYTYNQLQKNTATHPNVDIFNYAAFSEETEIKFHDYGLENCAYNSGFGIRGEKTDLKSKELIVRARKIDNVIREKGYKRVDLVKIDAESSEFHVLNGMVETLNTFRPGIIVEVGDCKISGVPNSEEIVTWLEKRGYFTYEIHNSNLIKHIKKTHYGYGNILFIPGK